jgi:hypothetical protein
MPTLNDLSEEGKQELALALILWKAFKKSGDVSVEHKVWVYKKTAELAEMLGVKKQMDELDRKILTPIKITFE